MMRRMGAAAVAVVVLASVVAAVPGSAQPPPPPGRFTTPPEVVVNDDGTWSWFQDERVIIHGCDLIVGSVPGGEGAGGTARAGNVEVGTVDLATGATSRDVLNHRLNADAHASPVFIEQSAGDLLASWSGHGTRC